MAIVLIIITSILLLIEAKLYVDGLHQKREAGDLRRSFKVKGFRRGVKLFLIVLIFTAIMTLFEGLVSLDYLYLTMMLVYFLFQWWGKSKAIEVRKNGLIFNNRFLSWEEIKEVKLNKRKIVISVDKSWIATLSNEDVIKFEECDDIIKNEVKKAQR